MLIRHSTVKVLAQNISNFGASLKQSHQIMKCILQIKYNFIPGTNADTDFINKYLTKQQNKLKKHTNSIHKFETIIVPRFNLDEEQLQQKLESEWKNKKILLNVDPSALIGRKRLFMKNHLQKNVYQGTTNPQAIFSEQNPSFQLDAEELKFDDDYFLTTDPLAKEILQKTQGLDEEKQQQILYDALADIYEKQPQRFGNRLKNQLNVPQQYHKIIQLAMYNQNPIYFCGFNEYAFRNLITKLYGLNQLKQIFMLSLKFAQSESYKYKVKQQINTRKIQEKYTQFARQLIYLNNYKAIKKIQNGEIFKRVNFISQYLNQESDIPENQSKAGRRNPSRKIKPKSSVLFAHSYTIQTLHQYVLIKNIQSYFTSAGSKISQISKNSPGPLQKIASMEHNPQETDAQRIQKHSILQVMLGNLWNQPYTLNRFPYLSQSYIKLNGNDQQHVKNLYHQHLTKYSVAKRVYYEKYINKLDTMAAHELKDVRTNTQYKSIQQEVQKATELIKSKKQEKQKLKQMKQMKGDLNMAKDERQGEIQYKEKYEQEVNEESNALNENIKVMLEQQLKQQNIQTQKLKKRGRSAKKPKIN